MVMTLPNPSPLAGGSHGFAELVAELRQNLEREAVEPQWLKEKLHQISDWLSQGSTWTETGLGITERLRHSQDLFAEAVQQVRTALGADRVVIYRFQEEGSQGTVVAESLRHGFTPALGETLPAAAFGLPAAPLYEQEQGCAISNIYEADLTPYQRQIQEKFQVRALLALPITTARGAWGLLVAHHCLGSHGWQGAELGLLAQVSRDLGLLIEIAELKQQLQGVNEERQRIEAIIERVREPLSPDEIFRVVTQDVRKLLNCDRAVVYKFNPDWSGDFVAESVAPGWVALVGQSVKDTNLEMNQGGRYARGDYQAIEDIYAANFDPCHLRLLEQFQARAYVLVPVFSGDRLWGILGAYQNSGPRQWQAKEITWLAQIGKQLAVAARQADALVELRSKNESLAKAVEREQTLSTIVDRIRQSLDLATISRTTVREVRRFLQADRVAIFQLDAASQGNDSVCIAEDVLPGFGTAQGSRVHDHCLGEQYLPLYAQGRYQALADVQQAELSDCYLQILEQFQVRAHLVVPLLKGNRVWGLLCVHQCRGPRGWQPEEIQFVQQVASQFGIALQQIEFLEQLQQKNAELAAAAERERSAKENLQQGALRVLQALAPSFQGDLTVRAPITEDEIGTIADGYNTTIQSLRELVRQVKVAAAKVAKTSADSSQAVDALAGQAAQQVQELNQALEQLATMVESIAQVAADAQQVDQAVQVANQRVAAGDEVMERTVEGILDIRQTVAETAKKIKRLGESSQKIAKVVRLIENFATQTNLLALNAAIEATRAGEYGRGFAVVADEVRSLAYQSANATGEIERLVQDIQTETQEVIEAMEVGIAQVIQGTNLVNETRQNLTGIAAATEQISQLVAEIRHSTATQTQRAEGLNQAMQAVATIANQTAQDAQGIARSFQELLTTSAELEAQVSRFRVD
ncbi:MAG: GAF domain-containing protein [Thermostichales cyanobacterium HHBFW_bins_127]